MNFNQLIGLTSSPDDARFSPAYTIESPEVQLVKTELFSVYESKKTPVYEVTNIPSEGGALPCIPKNLKVIFLGLTGTGKSFFGERMAKTIGAKLVDENDEGIGSKPFARHTKSEQILKSGENAVVSYAAANWQSKANSQLLSTCASHTLVIEVRSDQMARQHRVRSRKGHRVEAKLVVGAMFAKKAVTQKAPGDLFREITEFVDLPNTTFAFIENPLGQSEVADGLVFGHPIYSCYSILGQYNKTLEDVTRKYFKDVEFKGKYHVTMQRAVPNATTPFPPFDLKTHQVQTDVQVLAVIKGKNISLKVKLLHVDAEGNKVWLEKSPHDEQLLHITMYVGPGFMAKHSVEDAEDDSSTVIDITDDKVVVRAEMRLAKGDETMDIFVTKY